MRFDVRPLYPRDLLARIKDQLLTGENICRQRLKLPYIGVNRRAFSIGAAVHAGQRLATIAVDCQRDARQRADDVTCLRLQHGE